jgi:hypothetical protein
MNLREIGYINFDKLSSNFNCNNLEQNVSIELAGKLRAKGLNRLVDFSRRRARGAIQNHINWKIKK